MTTNTRCNQLQLCYIIFIVLKEYLEDKILNKKLELKSTREKLI